MNYTIRLLIKEKVAKRGQIDEIHHIDLERKHGVITILGQYNAFARTQELLEIESTKLIDSIDRQLEQVKELKIYANDSTAKRDVMNWLNRSVVPNLVEAKQKTMLLTESISEISKLPINPKVREFQKLLTAESNPKGIKRNKTVEQKKQTKRAKPKVNKTQVKRKK